MYRGSGYSSNGGGGYGCGYLANSQPAKRISMADTVVPDTEAADTAAVVSDTRAVADMGTTKREEETHQVVAAASNATDGSSTAGGRLQRNASTQQPLYSQQAIYEAMKLRGISLV